MKRERIRRTSLNKLRVICCRCFWRRWRWLRRMSRRTDCFRIENAKPRLGWFDLQRPKHDLSQIRMIDDILKRERRWIFSFFGPTSSAFAFVTVSVFESIFFTRMGSVAGPSWNRRSLLMLCQREKLRRRRVERARRMILPSALPKALRIRLSRLWRFQEKVPRKCYASSALLLLSWPTSKPKWESIESFSFGVPEPGHSGEQYSVDSDVPAYRDQVAECPQELPIAFQ